MVNKTETQEKNAPFFKQIWFWTLILSVILVLIFGTMAGVANSKTATANKTITSLKDGNKVEKRFNEYMRNNIPNYSSYASDALDYALGNGSTSSSSEESSSTEESSDYSDNVLSFGTSADFQNGLSVNIVSVTSDPSVELNDSSANGKAVVLKVTLENKTNETVSVNPNYFAVYGKDGSAGSEDSETYGLNNWPDQVNVGQKITLRIVFSVPEDGPYSATFGDATWK